jgi:hypothetical protein
MNRTASSEQIRSALLTKADERRAYLSGARRELRTEPVAKAMRDAVRSVQRDNTAERMDYWSRILRQVEGRLAPSGRPVLWFVSPLRRAIGKKRLHALPWAPFRLRWQERAESPNARLRRAQSEMRTVA